MNIAAIFIRRPVATTLLVLSILIFGIMGYRQLPVSDLPTVDFPTIQVNAGLPGASPETMAASVATPLEKQFSTIAGVTSISSTNAQGSTSITLQFDLSRSIDARRPGRAVDDRPGAAAAAARHAVAAVVPEGQPGRHAGPVPDAELADAAARPARPLRAERHRAAPLDGHGRRAGQRLRLAEVRGARGRRPAAARVAPDRHRPGGAGDRGVEREPADGDALRAGPQLRHRDVRPAARRRRRTTASSSPTATAARCG